MEPQTIQDKPSTTSSPFRSSSGRSSYRGPSKRRIFLFLLAIIVLVLMVIGIVFAAHHYYVQFGGQGWLKKRTFKAEVSEPMLPHLYLPLRRGESFAEVAVPRSPAERTSGNIPFYTCGDQQESCEEFSQPDICCPVGMFCFAASFTNSGIYCCNTTSSIFNCQASQDNPPECMTGTVQCSVETGGGCCPKASECSPNGCIHLTNATILVDNATSSSAPSIVSVTTAPSNTPSTTVLNSVVTTVTITEIPAAIETFAKGGEIAQVAEGIKRSMVLHLCLPYSAFMVLVLTAGIMGFF